MSVSPRETRVGRGAFILTYQEISNQLGELVARVRQSRYLYVPLPGREGAPGPHVSVEPFVEAVGGWPSNGASIQPRAIDWTNQLHFEQVSVGDVVPSVAYALTLFRLVVAAGASRDFYQVHHNSEVAVASGATHAFASSTLIQGMWERAVREYIGLNGRFKRMGPCRLRRAHTVGELVLVGGTVGRKWADGDQNCVELDMLSRHSGRTLAEGTVVVALPSRRSK